MWSNPQDFKTEYTNNTYVQHTYLNKSPILHPFQSIASHWSPIFLWTLKENEKTTFISKTFHSGTKAFPMVAATKLLTATSLLLTSHDTMIAAAERHKVSGALGISGGPGAVVM